MSAEKLSLDKMYGNADFIYDFWISLVPKIINNVKYFE